jgi:hypothetical protein
VGSYPWASAFWTDTRQTVAPPRGAKDGLLPPLLVALTAVTGLVDAFSYLVLGHVFVANMTGAHAARRLISVAAMFLGALAGALLVLRVNIVYPLVIALIILAAVAVLAVTWARNIRTSPHPAP